LPSWSIISNDRNLEVHLSYPVSLVRMSGGGFGHNWEGSSVGVVDSGYYPFVVESVVADASRQ